MTTKLPTPKQVACAWHGIKQEYGARRNKMRDGDQWEVYVNLDVNWPISDDTVKVLSVHAHQDEAESRAESLENDARAKAVLALFQST
jgi:hypothetical protein